MASRTDQQSLACQKTFRKMNPNLVGRIAANISEEPSNENNILGSSNMKVHDGSVELVGVYSGYHHPRD